MFLLAAETEYEPIDPRTGSNTFGGIKRFRLTAKTWSPEVVASGMGSTAVSGIDPFSCGFDVPDMYICFRALNDHVKTWQGKRNRQRSRRGQRQQRRRKGELQSISPLVQCQEEDLERHECEDDSRKEAQLALRKWCFLSDPTVSKSNDQVFCSCFVLGIRGLRAQSFCGIFSALTPVGVTDPTF